MVLARRQQPAAAVLQRAASAGSRLLSSVARGSSLTPLALVAGWLRASTQQERSYRLAE
jgi:hypothetical protein